MSMSDVININYECFIVELSGDACVIGLRSVTFLKFNFFNLNYE